MENVKKAVESNEIADIRRTLEELQQESYKLSEMLYKRAAQGDGSSPQPGTNGSGAKPSDEEVIDADFNQ